MEHLPRNKSLIPIPNHQIYFPENAVYVRPIKEEERTPEYSGFKYAVHSEDGNCLGLISEFDQISLVLSQEDVVFYLAH